MQFIKEKDIFSDVLMNIGKKVLRDLFLMDDLKFLLSKANFRRYIEVKVKSYLGKEFLDFECASHIHLFEKMKKSLFNHPLLNEKNKILFVEEKNVVMENSEQLVEYKEKLLDESKAEDMIFLSNIDDRDNNFNTNNQNIIAENRNENIPNHYINEIINDNENKIRTPESEYNFLSNSTQDDILNIIINDKNCSHSDLEDKREKIFYLIHSYVSFYFFIDRRNFILRSLLIKC